jgi:lysozyme
MIVTLFVLGVGIAMVASQNNRIADDVQDNFVPDYAGDFAGDFTNSEQTGEDQIFNENIESVYNMQPSQLLIDSLKRTEGLSLKKYRDTSKGWSIGYGRFFPGGVGIPDTITRETAEQWLAEDLEDRAAKYVRLYIKRALTQPQFDGFTHMFYNISPPSMRNIANAFNAYGDWQSVALRYTLPGQKEEPMLIKRRNAEIAMIDKGIYA